MVGIVFGLVEAGTRGWSSLLTVGSLAVGAFLLGLFVRIETRAEEPIVPLRLFASGTRTTANVSRGLMYAGMYGMFFFVGQFLQDVQGYSPLRTGLCFLPVPASVFLSSQLVSKVLIRRVHPKVLIMSGISLTVIALLMSTQLHAGASYLQIFVSLVLLGTGSGTALVPLTQAGLAGVEPADAGARPVWSTSPSRWGRPGAGGARHRPERGRGPRAAEGRCGCRPTSCTAWTSPSASPPSSASRRWSWWPSWSTCPDHGE
jgi:predicted MFS family arabinose efflux permease